MADALVNGLILCALVMSTVTWAAQPLGCLIEPNQVVELGSPVIGVLDAVHVDRGSFVRKGQVLATLKADVERASADVAKSRAQAEADVRAAIANRDYNKQRLARAEELVKKNFIANQSLDQAKAEADVAEQRLAQAREQKRIWDREYDMARAQLALRSLISPLSGVVVDRYLHPGERVEERAVLKLAALNPLRVEVFMPAAAYREVKPGMKAKVYPELPDAGEHIAKVILVDRLIDPASNTFRVRLELPNPGNALPAGLRCKVALGDQMVESGGVVNKAAPPSSSAPVKVTPPQTAAPAPVKTTPTTTPKANVVANTPDPGILKALEAWRKAWSSGDMASYVAAYVPDYQGSGPSREAWRKERETRIAQAGALQIHISDVQVQILDNTRAQVQFQQNYHARRYQDQTWKTLMMVLDHGRWLIREERTGR
jgi:RND family efflux transporter MFP subunit